jgi:thiamine biosynthesis lipoprotein
VNAGGNLKVFGSKPDKSSWNIGIRHPRKPGEYYSIITLPKDFAIATSGDYEQYFITNGVRYCHLFDPRTGYPARNGVVSVSVIFPRAEDTDGYSKLFFIGGADSGLRYADKNHIPVLYILETNNILFETNSLDWAVMMKH